MIKRALFLIVVLFCLSLFTLAVQDKPSPDRSPRWYMGNTHCHTLNSDGDSSPWEVAEFYKDQGYDFVFITDHNFITSVERLNSVYGEEANFLVIPGAEVSKRFGDKRIHVCALNPERFQLPDDGASLLSTLQDTIRITRTMRAVPIIAHPNYRWSLGPEELERAGDCHLFELFNAHPAVNNIGWGEKQSTEEMWDKVLSEGKIIYGVAADDAHCFRKPWDRTEARPNQGWVMVEAVKFTAEDIVEALDEGRFYSSTGVELEDYKADEAGVMIKVKQERDAQYRIQFIGREGRIFFETSKIRATYSFKGDEKYIRIRIEDSNGNRAWTQPVMLSESSGSV
jgi:hypothetical protein